MEGGDGEGTDARRRRGEGAGRRRRRIWGGGKGGEKGRPRRRTWCVQSCFRVFPWLRFGLYVFSFVDSSSPARAKSPSSCPSSSSSASSPFCPLPLRISPALSGESAGWLALDCGRRIVGRGRWATRAGVRLVLCAVGRECWAVRAGADGGPGGVAVRLFAGSAVLVDFATPAPAH